MLAHFSHFLCNNEAPTEYEACQVKALKVNALEEISVLDTEIEQLENILDSLKCKQANIQESVDDNNSNLAPVHRLSMDVLGEIFAHCLATKNWNSIIINASEAPVLITHVCSTWRSIALPTPQLWSKFHMLYIN